MQTQEQTEDFFLNNPRRIKAKVEMNFYANETVTAAQCGAGWSDAYKQTFAAFPDILQNLNSPGLAPKYRYATLDGNSYMAESADNPACVYPVDPALKPVFPVWSEGQSAAAATAGVNGYGFTLPPVYTVDYKSSPRKTNRIFLIGDEKWNQYPVDFDVTLYALENAVEADFDALLDDLPDFGEISIAPDKMHPQTLPDGRKSFTVSIRNSSYARAVLLLPKTYEVTALSLTVRSINAKTANAKIMFLGSDLSIVFDENDVSQISVLEEKSDSVEELSYGLTSNACTVTISNKNERFILYRHLLKTNRVVQPYAVCEKRVAQATVRQEEPLGKFYSDKWEISSDSEFINCKAYDVLFALQTMPLVYTMDGNSSQSDYPLQIDTNKSAAYVFGKVFRLINEEKRNNGIFGSNIEAVIDPRLNEITIDRVLLGCDTAWNILQQLANRTLSNIYADREGNVHIEKDAVDLPAPARLRSAPVQPEITPKNSFSYELPAMNCTLVNRALVPYVRLTEESLGDNKLNITVEKKDFIIQRGEDGIAQKIQVSVKFEKGFSNITSCALYKNNESDKTNVENLKITFNGLSFTVPFNENIDYFRMEIETSLQVFKLEEFATEDNDYFSQSQNGIKAFECKCGSLIDSEAAAKTVAQSIVKHYSRGKAYIAAEWTGTPRLKLGHVFSSSSLKMLEPQFYEALSNEFTLEVGFRQKTKARQK